MAKEPPLLGTLVLDCSRMIPGAVAARLLLDLGVRLIKVEEPGIGDPLRGAPPFVGGIGAGFRAFYRGAESLCLDLRESVGASALRRLARNADVLVESFRPGTMAGWGLGPEQLQAGNPSLVICSLTGFGSGDPRAGIPGHDLNFTASSGLLSLLPSGGLPRIPFSDVSGGLLACISILAALHERRGTGRGRRIEQPLAESLEPFLAWNRADRSAGGGGLGDRLLSGNLPSYRLYGCQDGLTVALCALEPKFWDRTLEMLAIEGCGDAALDSGPLGEEAAKRIGERLRTRPREEWLRLARERGLPLTPCLDPGNRDADSPVPASLLPSFGAAPAFEAPSLGEHSAAVLREFGLDQTERWPPP